VSGKRHTQNAKKLGENGKSEDLNMSAALAEAREWAKVLERRERFKHDTTRDGARSLLARKIGIPCSYLFRLRHKWRDMKGVDGDVYRALMLEYNRLCERIEAAADHEEYLLRELTNGGESSTGRNPVDHCQD
jgi:hypothetical protein